MGFEACVDSAIRRFDINSYLKFIVALQLDAAVKKVHYIRGHFYGREFQDSVIFHPLFKKSDVLLFVEYTFDIPRINSQLG